MTIRVSKTNPMRYLCALLCFSVISMTMGHWQQPVPVTAGHSRYLKGGLGGGGGGRGGTYTGRGGSCTGDDCSGESLPRRKRLLLGLIIPFGTMLLVSLFCCWAEVKEKKRFKEHVGDCKIKVAADMKANPEPDTSSSSDAEEGNSPASGRYKARFTEELDTEDEPVVRVNVVSLTFTPKSDSTDDNNKVGWDISGSGHDEDGGFVVEEGEVGPTGEAYWIEKQDERRVLNHGKFDFSNKRFYGGWHANNGKNGTFVNFGFDSPFDANGRATKGPVADEDALWLEVFGRTAVRKLEMGSHDFTGITDQENQK